MIAKLLSFIVTLLLPRADILARTEQTRKDYATRKKEVLEKTQQVRTLYTVHCMYVRELPTVGHFHAWVLNEPHLPE